MSNFKNIRKRLGVTQAAMAEGLGCSQGNVSFYEKGQTVPPEVAGRLIAYAKTLNEELTFDDIYSAQAGGECNGKAIDQAAAVIPAPVIALREKKSAAKHKSTDLLLHPVADGRASDRRSD